ncbi:MAG TPA: GTPase ObgE [Balneolales bacterium]|nr:GTPase ObgE [Balneolales bacterium]
MRFADYAKMYIKAGDGGSGSVHFRREKYVPRGGPDGGEGGKGGDIVLRGNAQLNTLLDLRYKKFLKANKGENGAGALKTGKDADPIILEVPLGTVAYEEDTRKVIGEVTEDKEDLVIAKGGKGGYGNAHFKSATNQTPRFAQEGEKGEEKVVEIELKLIADVGLVGFPNAGKSTLLSSLSSAKPKIADYPFTTLEPNLGVVSLADYRSFVMADIPGIIEEAHQGKGLGIRFLRHIERNDVLLFVISANTDINYEYKALCDELKAYREDLLEKPRIIAISKMDLLEDYKLNQKIDLDAPYITISAATGYHLNELKEMIWNELEKQTDD